MWRIGNPELRPAKLDFTSSEQGWREVTQLFAGEVQLINAVELVHWDSDEVQVLICESCGIDHCKSGDWVRVRRSGSMVLMLPALDYVSAQREEDRIEYRPPKYLSERGIAYFDLSTYEGLHAQSPVFPAFDEILQLNMREAALMFHWTAPARVLGTPPAVRVNEKLIVGASEGVVADHIQHLEKLLHDSYTDDSAALLRPLNDTDLVISIYLQASEFIDWKAVAVDRDGYRLVVDSRFVIVRE